MPRRWQRCLEKFVAGWWNNALGLMHTTKRTRPAILMGRYKEEGGARTAGIYLNWTNVQIAFRCLFERPKCHLGDLELTT